MSDTTKPMQGTWKLVRPDGRTYHASSPLACLRDEQQERIPPQVALQRIMDAADEPTQREKDMALMLKRMCRLLEPGDNMREAVTDYLRRAGLFGSPLRAGDSATDEEWPYCNICSSYVDTGDTPCSRLGEAMQRRVQCSRNRNAGAAGDGILAALAAPGVERLRDFYAVGPAQRAAVETFVEQFANLCKSPVSANFDEDDSLTVAYMAGYHKGKATIAAEAAGAAPTRCKGCDLPNGCPEYCWCSPMAADGVSHPDPASSPEAAREFLKECGILTPDGKRSPNFYPDDPDGVALPDGAKNG